MPAYLRIQRLEDILFLIILFVCLHKDPQRVAEKPQGACGFKASVGMALLLLGNST
ncbi:MAG: hypothetical protein WDN69_00340 [Aliidongia sp.]